MTMKMRIETADNEDEDRHIMTMKMRTDTYDNEDEDRHI